MKKLIGILIVVALVAWFAEHREYYYNADKSKCITVWKRIGGKCYLIPYRYSNLWAPSDNYILTDNRNALTIVWLKKPEDSLIISNDYGFPTILKFSSYKARFYDFKSRRQFIDKYYILNKINLEYLMIDIKENLAIVNGKKI